MADRADERAREIVGEWFNANNGYLGGTDGPATADLAQRIATALREERARAIEEAAQLCEFIAGSARMVKNDDPVLAQGDSMAAAIRTLEAGRGD